MSIDLGSFTPRLLLNNLWRILIVRHVAAYCTLNIATALSQEGQSFAEQYSAIDMFSFGVKLTTFKTQHTQKKIRHHFLCSLGDLNLF